MKNLLESGLQQQTAQVEPADFWEELSEEQRQAIETSIQKLEAGGGVPYEEIMSSFRNKLRI